MIEWAWYKNGNKNTNPLQWHVRQIQLFSCNTCQASPSQPRVPAQMVHIMVLLMHLPSSIQCFNGWKGIMKQRLWARGKCLLCVISMLQDENISSNTKFMVEHYCTCRRLQNNRTRFHSSSVRVRSPILWRFSALVSRMLSSYTKSSTNWKETRQLHIKKGSIIHTSLFSSALLRIT